MKIFNILALFALGAALAGCEATGLEIDATPQAFTPASGAQTVDRTWDGAAPSEKTVENPPAFR